MSQSPVISEKQQMREKRKKIQAFKSFLQKNQSPSILQQSVVSDPEDKIEEVVESECVVCQIQLGERRRFCGFCRNAACNDHMRKKRKSRAANKFVRICDSCEDQYLYKKYMKLQLKGEESISAQESIFSIKKTQAQEQRNGRKTKLQLLYNKQNELLRQKQQNDNKYATQDIELKNKHDKLSAKLFQIEKLETQLDTLEKKLPPSLEQDYNALEIENDKVVKQLVKYQKRCNQAIKAKSKRQKQIYQEYHQWEQKQKKSKEAKNQDDCHIF